MVKNENNYTNRLIAEEDKEVFEKFDERLAKAYKIAMKKRFKIDDKHRKFMKVCREGSYADLKEFVEEGV